MSAAQRARTASTPAPPSASAAATVDDLPARRGRGKRPAAVQPEGAAGEPAAQRGRAQRHRRPGARARRLGPRRRARHRDPVHARARGHAGLHRRAVRRRPRRDARGDGRSSAATRRRSTRSCRRSWSSTTRSSSTSSARPDAFERNAALEFERNKERYQFLRWGQDAFADFKVVPPDTGIVHQVNLEYLARVVFEKDGVAYPDTLVGTDSHTTMINGLGVLGWGVGGIEAEAAMLGQPVSMLIPRVVGFKLSGELPEGATATDLVLTITEMLRKHGVVGKFVEFYGPGVSAVPLANRATIGNMSPEYGSTCAIFPVDDETLTYLRLTGRDPHDLVALVEAYCQGAGALARRLPPSRTYSERLELDLSTVEPSLAGPKRPQDRVPLRDAKAVLPDGAGRLRRLRRDRRGRAQARRCPRRMSPTASTRAPTRRRASPSRRATPPRSGTRPPRTSQGGVGGARATAAARAARPGDRSRTARSSSSTTAPSSSPRSRRAPTRPTRPSWSAPGCWRRRPSSGACSASRG